MRFLIFAAILSLSVNCSYPAFAQQGGGDPVVCPISKLFDDGTVVAYASTKCTPTGPACVQQRGETLAIFRELIPVADLDCQADINMQGCSCKTSKPPFGENSQEIDAQNAKAVNGNSVGGFQSCDSYFVSCSVNGATKYFRCYKLNFKILGDPATKTKLFAFQSTNPPASSFTTQGYATTFSGTGNNCKITVQEPQGGGSTVTREFKVVYSGLVN